MFANRKLLFGVGGGLLVVIIALVATVKIINRKQSDYHSPNDVPGQSRPDSNRPDDNQSNPTSKLPAGNYDKTAAAQLTGGQCSGTGSVPIIPPMKLDQVGSIQPYGLMVGGHVTPIDHQYYTGLDRNALRDTYDVVAPADGQIVSIQHRGDKVNTPLHTKDIPSSDEYRFVFAHTCSFLTYVDLVTSIDDSIKAKLPASWTPDSNGSYNIPVKKGDIIGHIGGQTLDFAVWDLSQKPLPGLLVRAAYDNAEPWKVFTAPTTNYLDPKIKDQTIAKYVRKVAPVDGKIDYDVDGKLIGTWFQENTNGYDAGRINDRTIKNYWKTHLAFAPNYVIPSVYTFSIGNYTSQKETSSNNPDNASTEASSGEQFGISPTAPDPANVDTSNGLVKYDLFKQTINNADGSLWQGELNSEIRAKNAGSASGVLLVQMLEKRKIKVEAFPGKTASQVSAFDDKAIIYTRGDDSKVVTDTRTETAH